MQINTETIPHLNVTLFALTSQCFFFSYVANKGRLNERHKTDVWLTEPRVQQFGAEMKPFSLKK